MKTRIVVICVLIFQFSFAQIKTTISQLKGINKKNSMVENSILSVEGYVVGDSLPILVSDLKYYLRNSILPEGEYLRLDEDLSKAILQDKSKYFGKKVRIKGRIETSAFESGSPSDTSAVSKMVLDAPLQNMMIIGGNKINIPKLSIVEVDKLTLSGNAPQPPNNNYALLYSGGYDAMNAHIRYYNDLEFMYLVLKYKYGYRDENIVVVYKDGRTVNASKMPVDFPASRSGVDSALADLSNRMGKNGNLFLFLTNHGGGFSKFESENQLAGGLWDVNLDEIDAGDERKVDETIFYYKEPYNNNTISDDDFALKIKALQLNSLIAVLEPCFGGGFIADLKAPRRVVISAANEFEYSYGRLDIPFDDFSYSFTSALNSADHRGNKVNADSNADGKISIFEAYNYARTVRKLLENPMIDDNGDGLSDEKDGFYSSGISLKDGQAMLVAGQ